MRIRSFWQVCPAKMHVLYNLKANDAKFIHADNEDSDQTARMRSLVRVFIGAHIRRYVFPVAVHMVLVFPDVWLCCVFSCIVVIYTLFIVFRIRQIDSIVRYHNTLPNVLRKIVSKESVNLDHTASNQGLHCLTTVSVVRCPKALIQMVG